MTTTDRHNLYRAYQNVRDVLAEVEDFHIPNELFDWINHEMEAFEIDVHDVLASRKQIAIIWSLNDVQQIRPDLSEEQCWDVLKACRYRHDATLGITWETLRCQAELLFRTEPQQKGDEA